MKKATRCRLATSNSVVLGFPTHRLRQRGSADLAAGQTCSTLCSHAPQNAWLRIFGILLLQVFFVFDHSQKTKTQSRKGKDGADLSRRVRLKPRLSAPNRTLCSSMGSRNLRAARRV